MAFLENTVDLALLLIERVLKCSHKIEIVILHWPHNLNIERWSYFEAVGEQLLTFQDSLRYFAQVYKNWRRKSKECVKFPIPLVLRGGPCPVVRRI